jgi:hypothetical protein
MHLTPIIEADNEAGSSTSVRIGKILSASATESSGVSDRDSCTYTSLSDTESIELGSVPDAVAPQPQQPQCMHPVFVVCVISIVAVILWICRDQLL